MLDDVALADAAIVAPDGAEMLQGLYRRQRDGRGAQFAALAERLLRVSSDFDGLIAEVAGQTDADAELGQLELLGAIRQIRSQALKYEAGLVARGLRTEAKRRAGVKLCSCRKS
jgi:DNA primase